MTTRRSIRSQKWLNSHSSILLASFLAATGCREEGEQGPYCDWVEEEVPLDYSLGSWGGDQDYDLQPGKVLEQLTVPLQGTLTWNGGGNWAQMTPSEGMTEFTSTLSHGDRVIYRRVPGADGDLYVACPDALDLKVSIQMRTDDGVLDETWEATASFELATGNVIADIDAEAVGLVDTIQVEPKPEPPVPVENLSYAMILSYNIHPLSPQLPKSGSGRVYLLGDYEVEQQDEEIMDLGGVSRLLMEWEGMEGG
ncbi:MAG: hypothetical protein AAGF11_47220 [Myxococcota bacterium]